jgi:hypothetical protein
MMMMQVIFVVQTRGWHLPEAPGLQEKLRQFVMLWRITLCPQLALLSDKREIASPKRIFFRNISYLLSSRNISYLFWVSTFVKFEVILCKLK